MAVAAHPTKFYVKVDNTTAVAGDEVAGINTLDFGPSIDLLDITDFMDTSGAKKKLAALTDGSVSCGGDLDMTSAPANLIRSSMLTGASIWVTVHFNPTGSASQRGFKVECKVASYKVSAKVDGKAEFSADLQFNGTPALE